MKTALSFATLFLFLFLASPAEAHINRLRPLIVFEMSDGVGWLSDSAVQTRLSRGYTTGWTTIDGRPILTRGFFNFDLKRSLAMTPKNYAVVGAELEFGGISYLSPDPLETLGIFDVTTPAASLYARTHIDSMAFNDLGSGVLYASANFSPGGNDRITIPLNADAIHDIRANHGGLFSFGLSLISARPSYITNESLFSLGGSIPELRILIARVPEPSTDAIAATSVLALLFIRRRRSL